MRSAVSSVGDLRPLSYAESVGRDVAARSESSSCVRPALRRARTLFVQQLKTGHGVSIAALRAEITTAEAAELLNVSRPFVIKLLESGVMPFRKVGTHRRVRLIDVLEYRDRQDAVASAALDEMVRQAEKHGLYD